MNLQSQVFRAAWVAAFSLSIFAAAQDDAEESPDAAAAEAPADENTGGAKPAAPPGSGGESTILPKPTGGDKVYMKSGTVMSGVQVLRSNPANYEVQLIAGEAPMLIPRRQVDRVEYDDIDPVRDEMRERMFPKPKEVTMASGERVTTELRDKLEAPVSAEPLVYKDLDLLAVLSDIQTKTQVKLKIDPSVESRAPNQRKWSVEIAAGRTLQAVLREDMVNRFNWVDVILETDTVLVLTKDAAKKRAEEAAAAAPAADGAVDPAAGAAAPPQTPPPAVPAQIPPLRKSNAPSA